jgi:hypothetical protein
VIILGTVRGEKSSRNCDRISADAAMKRTPSAIVALVHTRETIMHQRSLRTIARFAAASAVLSVALGATSATADGPTFVPLPAAHFELDVPDVPCGPIVIDATAGETLRSFTDRNGEPRFDIITGPLRATVTGNGNSIDLNIPGPLKVTSSGTLTLFGASLVFSPNVLWLTHGKVTFGPGAIDPTAWNGHITDLCDVLGF